MTYNIVSPREASTPNLFWSTFWNKEEALGDWRVSGLASGENAGGLDSSDGLASAVIISLFTDRRAPEGWRPDVVDRRGWWGDGVAEEGASLQPIGSHLWLLRNESVTAENIKLARLYAEEALSWMVREGVVASVSVESGAIENPRRGVWIDVSLFAKDGTKSFSERYSRFWDEVR